MTQGKRTVNDNEITRVMEESDEPAFTTSELADEFEMTVEGMRHRLETLAKKGDVHRKKPSPRTVLWWVKEDERDQVLSK